LFEVDIAVKELETSHFLALMVAANLDVGEPMHLFLYFKSIFKKIKKIIFFKLIFCFSIFR
jgi:hypothetical protein